MPKLRAARCTTSIWPAGSVSRKEQQLTGAGGQLLHLGQEPALETVDQGGLGGSSGRLERRLEGWLITRQLKERERVPVRLGQDALAHPVIHAARDDGVEHSHGGLSREPAYGQLGKSGKCHPGSLAYREHHCELLSPQAPRDERQHLGRLRVQPLRVVDQAQQRPLLGQLAQQVQHGQPNHEWVRPRPRLQAERRPQSSALRPRQTLQRLGVRGAESLQRGEGQVHLGLRARGTAERAVRALVGQEAEQGGLADAGITAQDQHPAATRPGIVQQVQQLALFGCSAEQTRSVCHVTPSRPPAAQTPARMSATVARFLTLPPVRPVHNG
jgi:hypothetical protein